MSFSSDDALITNQLPQTVNLPNMEDKDLYSDSLEELLKNIADTVNSKSGGLHSLKEIGASEQYYNKDPEGPLRNVYTKTFDLIQLNGGSIDASVTVQYSHEITNLCESAGIFAHCTSVDGLFFTAVFPDIRLNNTSIVFTNPHTQALSQCDIVAKYIKER